MNENTQLAHPVSIDKCKILSIQNLSLCNYRNYDYFNISFENKPIIITGNNGIGKTNILESISLLSPGRGIRGTKFSELINNKTGKNFWSINYKLDTIYSKQNVVIAYNESEGSKRIINIDDNNASPAELAKIFSVIWLTPQMDLLFIGPASSRRKFLDRLVYNFSPDHAKYINKYEYLVTERLKLIKAGRNDNNWLLSLEQNIAETSSIICRSRLETIEYLNNAILEIINEFPKANIFLQGEIEEFAKSNSNLKLEEYIKENLLRSRKIDSITGRTNFGIHKSDMIVYHMGKNSPASICSTGEQKSMLISIILADSIAKMKWLNIVPVLLLDEVIAHLDENRREALFDYLLYIKSQCFLTGTDKEIFKSLEKKAQFKELGLEIA